jgi:Secretion system C-terminal sorting domain
MKKFYTLGLLLISVLSFGQTIMYEGFNYTIPGFVGGNTSMSFDAVGSNSWFTHSNTSGNATTIDLSTSSLSYAGIAASTGNKVGLIGSNATTPRDINKAFTGAGASTVLYYSALINVVDNTQLTTPATSNSYFMSLGSSSGASSGNLGGRLAVTSSNGGANFRFSISNTSSPTTGGTTITYTDSSVDLNFGTTYLVVVKFDKTAALTSSTLWVNPSSLGGSEPASTLVNNSGNSTYPATFGSINLRNASATPKVEIDEIKVGLTWADVTSAVLSTQQNAISGLRVYPNPAKDFLYITSDNNITKQVVVYDVLGKVVINTKTTNTPVNVANLNRGVYVVKITEEGKTATRKLVIE